MGSGREQAVESTTGAGYLRSLERKGEDEIRILGTASSKKR